MHSVHLSLCTDTLTPLGGDRASPTGTSAATAKNTRHNMSCILIPVEIAVSMCVKGSAHYTEMSRTVQQLAVETRKRVKNI